MLPDWVVLNLIVRVKNGCREKGAHHSPLPHPPIHILIFRTAQDSLQISGRLFLDFSGFWIDSTSGNTEENRNTQCKEMSCRL